MSALLRRVVAGVERQRGHLFPWAPVAFGLGIAIYFTLPDEPGASALFVAAGLCACNIALARRSDGSARLAFWACALVCAGLLAGAVRTAQVAGPVLGFRYYGPVEGRVIALDRSSSGAIRVTLDRVQLLRVAPDRTPSRVRVALHGTGGVNDPEPGARLAVTAHLAPPGGPVEPGGFDFRRHAWFAGLGAVGYARAPAILLAPSENPLSVARIRRALARHVRDAMPGDTGAFAAVILTGDRSEMSAEALNALRRSNLAHLLAISGLHMALLAGFVFGAVRAGLALWPWAALRLPGHKIAACTALGAAAGYLVIAGASVPTQRAFVMVAVALLAVLSDRRALSLRSVALAAMIVLALRPEALAGPGFQMSFAATVALVAAFDVWRQTGAARLPRWTGPVLAVFLSSAVAGAATAPFSAFHFNQVSRLGLIANLAAVPVMGALVMPAAVCAAVLAPFGLAAPALWVMGRGIDWILWVAFRVSEMGGAVVPVPTPPVAALVAVGMGGLLICLWQGRARFLGLAPMLVGLWLWTGVERPGVLVAENGGLVGIMGTQGRALSRAKGSGFVARTWLENDGDAADQVAAAARWRAAGIQHVTGAKRSAALRGCDGAEIIVSNGDVPELDGCLVLDALRLRGLGAVALTRAEGGGWHILPSRPQSGPGRPWAPGPDAPQ